MVTKLRAAGAYDVISYGAAWRDADTYLREHVMPYVSLASSLPPSHHTNSLHSTRAQQSTAHPSTTPTSGPATAQ